MFGTCFEHLKATCNRGKPETCQQQEQLQTKRKQSKKKAAHFRKKTTGSAAACFVQMSQFQRRATRMTVKE